VGYSVASLRRIAVLVLLGIVEPLVYRAPSIGVRTMKLFQKLLLAPAALGLMAPVAASAAELNIAGVSQYGSEEQVTSITQFSDVQPTDWAYQALSNLIERYGCVAGYPNGTYRGSRAMTRYEAAALLNACPVTARKDDASAAVQAVIVNVAGVDSISVDGGLIQTTSG
jgi:hypothetical protein